MRTQVIAGNWKMYKDLSESVELAAGIVNGINQSEMRCKVVLCPPFTSLETVYTVIKNSAVKLGGQNMHQEENGAFTGEISAPMLKAAGCSYVILGHSERRAIFGESDQLINSKIIKAINSGLLPIFCIGETLQERESGITFDVVKRQIVEGLKGLSSIDMEKAVIAYEPVWAIGTGKTATPEQAQEVHAFIRKLLSELYSRDVSEGTVIQYGGSVKPENAVELLNQPDIDGALVGGACLKADSFLKIIEAAK